MLAKKLLESVQAVIRGRIVSYVERDAWIGLLIQGIQKCNQPILTWIVYRKQNGKISFLRIGSLLCNHRLFADTDSIARYG